MAGWQRNHVTLTTGEHVRYSLKQRAGSPVYFVHFVGPDGRRLERSTGAAKKPDAVGAAHRLILEEYRQIVPSAESVPWEAARTKLTAAMTADGKRPKTVKGYLETLDKLVAMFPLAKGPADVTDRMAGDFKLRYAATRYVKKKKLGEGEVAPEYKRGLKSLDSRVRTLKAVFSWFKDLRLVEANPFEHVTGPDLDRHEVKYVRPGDVNDFFAWLDARWPGWAMPRLR